MYYLNERVVHVQLAHWSIYYISTDDVPLDLDKRPRDETLLNKVARHISAKHTRRLATGYLGVKTPDLENWEQDYKGNFRNVTYQCLYNFLMVRDGSQNRLYEKLKQAGIQEGLVPRIALDTFAGKRPQFIFQSG